MAASHARVRVGRSVRAHQPLACRVYLTSKTSYLAVRWQPFTGSLEEITRYIEPHRDADVRISTKLTSTELSMVSLRMTSGTDSHSEFSINLPRIAFKKVA